ncbi:TadE/TadG family type IV pilus assembly protein [Isoptericola sp. NPDC056578]|uniref:TadE/TadG family type IV pilus assembly protein n=1 Tax=Isoptericola sp. NPDC056578 TaxID=3345870 RepID=UPI00367ED38B
MPARTVPRRLRARRTSRAAERGSVSIWLALGAFVMIVVVGMAVDLSGQVLAQQHARDVAQQAARAGGQAVVASDALRGAGVSIDSRAAYTAAQQYLSSTGVSGSVQVVPGGDRVIVRTTDFYQPKFLGIIGIREMRVSGEGEARVVRAFEGVEQ